MEEQRASLADLRSGTGALYYSGRSNMCLSRGLIGISPDLKLRIKRNMNSNMKWRAGSYSGQGNNGM